MWAVVGVAVVASVLVALLASSKPTSQTATQSPLVGKAAPHVAGRVLAGGGTVSLSQLGGKWVVVNFAASWCIPCRQETPELLAFAAEHARAGDATVLEIAYDETDLTNLRAFLRSSKATWPAVDDGQAVVDYGVAGIPESYLVDPSGTVVAKYLGGVTAKEIDGFMVHASTGA
jgi:cytochrome c biogenesis protein CcmG/thiol:disulfide interchange protein DsbE